VQICFNYWHHYFAVLDSANLPANWAIQLLLPHRKLHGWSFDNLTTRTEKLGLAFVPFATPNRF
jgi:hypothetical protein